MAQQLGSDVPFFLLGGRAAAIGPRTELFPLPDSPARYGVLIDPGIHGLHCRKPIAFSGRFDIRATTK